MHEEEELVRQFGITLEVVSGPVRENDPELDRYQLRLVSPHGALDTSVGVSSGVAPTLSPAPHLEYLICEARSAVGSGSLEEWMGRRGFLFSTADAAHEFYEESLGFVDQLSALFGVDATQVVDLSDNGF